MPFTLKRENLLIKEQKKGYVESDEAVNYLDGEGLSRPIQLPHNRLIVLILLVIVGAAIGFYLAYTIIGNVLGSAENEQATLEENLARDVAYDLPILTNLVALDNEDIQQTFDDDGLITFETPNEDDSSDEAFTLIKLPADTNLDDMVSLYTQGISNLSASNAVKFLNGSWMFDVERETTFSMRVRYADFSSTNIEEAIDAAIETEGFNIEKASDIANDEAGNAYRSGTVTAGDSKYTWRVSACPLEDVYDISGLTNTAFYIGIRLTK